MTVCPVGRPAGMVATLGCEVTSGGMPVSPLLKVGRPVTTPSELVWVRKAVAGLL